MATIIEELRCGQDTLVNSMNETRDQVQALLDYCFTDKSKWKEGQVKLQVSRPAESKEPQPDTANTVQTDSTQPNTVQTPQPNTVQTNDSEVVHRGTLHRLWNSFTIRKV
jgi:hypothetical protein